MVQCPFKLFKGISAQSIIGIFPRLPARADSTRKEHLHIMGQGGIGDGKIIQQVTGTALAAGKHIDNGKVLGIGQGFQKACQILVTVSHWGLPIHRFFLYDSTATFRSYQQKKRGILSAPSNPCGII